MSERTSPPSTLSRQRRKMLVVALLLLGIAAVTLVPLVPSGAVPNAVAVSASSAAPPQRVVARGRIEPVERVRVVQGPAGAVLRKVYVRDGDHVKVGTPLAETDDHASLVALVALERSRLVEAERRYEQITAPAKRSEIQAQQSVIRQRSVELEKLEAEYERARKLAAGGIVSSEVEQVRRASRDEAQYALEQARSGFRALTETRDVDALVAEAHREVQKAALAKAEADLERAVIRAPMTGTVLALMAREGETMGAEGLLHLADLEHLQVVAEVDEALIGQVQQGQAASMTGAVLPTTVEGRVTRIAFSVFKQKRPTSDVLIGRDARIVEVEITPNTPLPRVIGSEVTVSIARESQ
ncbi:MAG: efflux RND transporter periplasmic adaptor subunit [Magnetococcus sp. WYHC-3]